MDTITGTAAGVPYLALPPSGVTDDAPLVVAWHLHDPPRSEAAMAAALPLDGLRAWRVYLGLPLSGSRLPEGGLDAFFRLGYEDAVLNVFEPTCRQAVEEFAPALTAVCDALQVGGRPLGLMGGSIGSLVALSVLAEIDVPVDAVALVSPAIRLTDVVGANERRFGVQYPWNEQSRTVAARLDFLARSAEIVRWDTATLLVLGALDDAEGIRAPALQLWQLLSERSPERNALTTIPGMAHALAEEPGLEPAPQTPEAARVDAAVVEWFRRHLNGATAQP